MLYDALKAIIGRHGSRVALRDKHQELTYEQLWLRSAEQAGTLQSLGVTRGDRVGILASNTVECVVAYWAIYRCQAVCVHLNEQLKTDALVQLVDDCGATLLLCDEADRSTELDDKMTCPVLQIEHLALIAEEEAVSVSTADLKTDPNRLANIVYTSGSMGTPKGVCLTHLNLMSVASMAGEGYSTSAEDNYLMVVPLHHIHGLMIMLTMNLRGACIDFMNDFADPVLVTRELAERAVTGFSGVPYHFATLIDQGGFLEAELPQLRWIGVTGGTITPERLQQLSKAHPKLDIHISYGQSECSPRITRLDPAKIDRKPESVGSVARGLSVEFLDDNAQPVPEGETGELVVSGPNVMQGYWNDEESTQAVIDEQGRLHTGDLACIDAEGDIFLKGRKQAMIKSAEERIFPEELEALLNAHPDVEEVAVTGVTDALYGQRVEAHIVLVPTSDESESSADRLKRIQAYCLSKTPIARAPRHYHLRDALPRMANGKTDKQHLLIDAEGR